MRIIGINAYPKANLQSPNFGTISPADKARALREIENSTELESYEKKDLPKYLDMAEKLKYFHYYYNNSGQLMIKQTKQLNREEANNSIYLISDDIGVPIRLKDIKYTADSLIDAEGIEDGTYTSPPRKESNYCGEPFDAAEYMHQHGYDGW